MRAGEKDYTFIEIMGCPGGCVNGGGQLGGQLLLAFNGGPDLLPPLIHIA